MENNTCDKIYEILEKNSPGFFSKNLVNELILLCDKLKNIDNNFKPHDIASEISNNLFFNFFKIFFTLNDPETISVFGTCYILGNALIVQCITSSDSDSDSDSEKENRILRLELIKKSIKYCEIQATNIADLQIDQLKKGEK